MDSERYYNLTDEELTLEFFPKGGQVCNSRKAQTHAYIETYRRFWDRVYFVAFMHLKTAKAAEEVVHEVFLLLWEKRKEFRIKSLEEHLSAITRYMVYHYLAKGKIARDQMNSNVICEVMESILTHQLVTKILDKVSNKFPVECRIVFREIQKEDNSPYKIPIEPKLLSESKMADESATMNWIMVLKKKLMSLLKI